MSGPGSGSRWRCHGKKHPDEQSLVIPMEDCRKRLYSGAAGTLTWTLAGGEKSCIGYCVMGRETWPTVQLRYRLNDQAVNIQVGLETTPTRFNGWRWWFICPLTVRGIPCKRRVGKLYLPPGGRYFGCRKCHDLTYRSCQEAHQSERLFARLGFDAEVAKLWDRKHRRM